MKKILTLILAVCAVSFASCKVDDSNSVVSLENTTWEGSYKPDPNVTASMVYKFASTTYTAVGTSGTETQNMNGTYTFAFPKVTLKDNDPTNTFQQTGTLNNDKLTLMTPSGMVLVLTKK